jgi:hypothetical protein
MSVLKLRRDMVVVEEGSARTSEKDTDTPFPLRRIEAEPDDVIEAELVAPDADDDGEPELAPHKTVVQRVGFWLKTTAIIAALGAYPVMVIAASDVGDGNLSGLVDRSQWAAPWTGGAAVLMQTHFDDLGWAADAQPWEPLARLTAKPAYQKAMAQSLGAVVALANSQAIAAGRPDADLEAAARLVSGDASGVQLRAARDALVNYDRRLKRRDVSFTSTPGQLKDQLALVSAWAAQSQAGILSSAASVGGNPMDEDATRAVYEAKGRATVAFMLMEALDWPQSPDAVAARASALEAWKNVAEFHPLVVLNGDPDGSVFGNHPAAVGFLLTQAEAATAALLATLPAETAPQPAAPAATATASE